MAAVRGRVIGRASAALSALGDAAVISIAIAVGVAIENRGESRHDRACEAGEAPIAVTRDGRGGARRTSAPTEDGVVLRS